MTGRYLSLFTGAGGMDLGLHNAGWTPTAFAEVDRDASDVLARHWPEVPNLGNVTNVDHQDAPDVDLIAGGFPCQDVSLAGRRAGLAGERSGLWWEFHRIVGAIRPRAVLVENVAGLLSSDGGRDMGAILDALGHLGYGVAWRSLDSQHFGVPQRRRRVFLLAILGGRPGAERAAEVLALTEGVRGDTSPRRETRPDVARTLTAGAHGRRVSAPGRRQEDDYNLAIVVGATGPVAHTLTAEGADASEDGTGRGTPIVAGALGTPRGGGHGLSADMAAGGQLVVNALDTRQGGADDNDAQAGHLVPAVAHTITVHSQANGTGHSPDEVTYIGDTTGVRRLTPRECERLQGWPDDWTRYRPDGSEISDSARYRLIGNGVTAPVTEWIGQRLAEHLTATAEAAA